MTCGIYKITHRESGRCYIGQSRNIERRWKEHKKERRSSRMAAISFALQKHGVDAFAFEVIETCKPEHLDAFETVYIRTFKASDVGFNVARLPRGPGMHSEETKAKIRKANMDPIRLAKSAQRNKARAVAERDVEKEDQIVALVLAGFDNWTIAEAVSTSVHYVRRVIGRRKGESEIITVAMQEMHGKRRRKTQRHPGSNPIGRPRTSPIFFGPQRPRGRPSLVPRFCPCSACAEWRAL